MPVNAAETNLEDAAGTGRVWSWHAPGGPEGLRMERRPVPVPGDGEVLVANRAIGLNPVDWKVMASGLPVWRPGQVPGVDGAGTVAAVGAGVRLPVGTRVAYHGSLARDGSFADFTCVEARALLLVPDALDDVTAAAMPCTGLTAWQAAAKVPDGPNRDVLVTGAGGAVGMLLAQRCLDRGWRVWATAAPRHHEALAAAGVAGAFDYGDAGWPDRLAAALGPRRLHALFDTVGSAAAAALAPMIALNGHLVYIQYRLESPPMPVFTTAISLHEVALNPIHAYGTAADWCALRAMGADLYGRAAIGGLQMPAIATHAFEALPAALTALRDGTGAGKPVIVP